MEAGVERFEKFFENKNWNQEDIRIYAIHLYWENIKSLGRIALKADLNRLLTQRFEELKAETRVLIEYAKMYDIELEG
jgi:predicted HTH domain antitoxin